MDHNYLKIDGTDKNRNIFGNYYGIIVGKPDPDHRKYEY